MILRGKFQGFEGSVDQEKGHFIVKDEHGKTARIPCDNKETIMQLNDAYGNVIQDGMTASVSHLKGKKIFYETNLAGELRFFIPEEQASEGIIQRYKSEHNINKLKEIS